MTFLRILISCSLVLTACSITSQSARDAKLALPPGAEARAMSGEPLFPPFLSPAERKKKEEQLTDARTAYEKSPNDADALIWYGRRTAYLGRFNDAIAIFTEGIAKHPDDARMYRHRGHRWITLRRFDRAIDDLEHAAKLIEGRPDETEPNGVPNAGNVDLETLNQNVYYHLALAYYLSGDFEKALPNWRQCLRFSVNPDSLCSGTHWTYMTLRRLGQTAEAQKVLAPITADMPIVEYHAYHRLLLVYKGEIDADRLLSETPTNGKTATDFATIGYGVGNWHLYNGRVGRAIEVFDRVAQCPLWPAFGRIAAEVELSRPRVTQ